MALEYLICREEIAEALAEGRPVVALESTLVAHGMPWPDNFHTALQLEARVRDAGATPATCAILGGKLRVGLSPDELEYLAQNGPQIPKCSPRDFAFVIAQSGGGATTVAGTMRIAHLAGIRIFATGGIGGVHRGAQQTFDISADLQELARTPVAVVCAGAKSILDLPLTLEYLETMGVPVWGYQTDELPAFYTPHSGLRGLRQVNSPAEAADLLRIHWILNPGGVVLANPISPAHAADVSAIEVATQQALAEASAKEISGKALTPFLLGRIAEISGGASLKANIALALNNAELAARVAASLSEGKTA